MEDLGKLSFLLKLAEKLDDEVHQEKEKRVLLNSLPTECKDIKPSEIKQAVIHEVKKGDDVVSYCRVRHHKHPGKPVKYSLGVKNFPKHEESEVEISKETFDHFHGDSKKTQHKHRYKLSSGWTIDETTDGKIIAEFEYKGKDNVKIPDGWDIKEVLR